MGLGAREVDPALSVDDDVDGVQLEGRLGLEQALLLTGQLDEQLHVLLGDTGVRSLALLAVGHGRDEPYGEGDDES